MAIPKKPTRPIKTPPVGATPVLGGGPQSPTATVNLEAQSRHREEDEVSRWQERIRLACKIFDKWEKKFLCKQGWEWYEGFQGLDARVTGDPSVDPYVVNLIYPTVEVKIPSLYFANPKATVIPKPSREDDSLTAINERARLCEDTANTIMLDPAVHLKDHTNLALKESFFYFGVVEIGYSASYVANPNQGKPPLTADYPSHEAPDEPTTEEGWSMAPAVQGQPSMMTADESIYVKRIPPQDFRVSPRASFILEDCDWSGYREWVYVSDLKADPAISSHAKNQMKPTGQYAADYTGTMDYESPSTDDMEADTPTRQGMICVWTIVDHRTRTRFMVPNDGGKFFIQAPVSFIVFPFSTIKHHERKEGWYPMPPHSNWLSPQAELNNTRQMEKIHRQRMVRRYQMQKGAMDSTEKDKLEFGGDGTIVETNTPVPAIVAIEDAPLDFAVTKNVGQSKEDFMEISAVGQDQRSNPRGDETATAATIGETRARIRDSFAQQAVATWLGDIAYKVLETAKAHLALPFWIQRNVDPMGPAAMIEAGRIAEVYQQITADQLGPLHFDVVVAAESLSPINEDMERQKFGEFMTILSGNPVLMLMLRSADGLLRKFLNLYGVRNEKVIQEVKLAIEVALLAQSGGASGQLPQDQGESGERAARLSGGGGPSPGPAPGGANEGPPAPGGLTSVNLPGLPASVGQLRAQMGLL